MVCDTDLPEDGVKDPEKGQISIDFGPTPASHDFGKVQGNGLEGECVNPDFFHDIRAHIYDKEAGGLAQWYYSSPAYVGDRVRGAGFWEEAIAAEDYYFPRVDTHLAAKASKWLSESIAIEDPRYLVFLGPGDAATFRKKDLVAVDGIAASGAMVVDTNIEFATSGLNEISKKYGHDEIQRISSNNNFFKGVPIPASSVKESVVATMFGGTLFNVTVDFDKNGNAVVPEERIIRRLKVLGESIGRGSHLIISHDANNDKEKVERAYKCMEPVCSNLGYRINRDTPFKVDAKNVGFRANFNEGSGIVEKYLTLDFQNDAIGLVGEREILSSTAIKMPLKSFQDICREAGFRSNGYIEEEGVYLHHLQWGLD